MKVQIVVFVFVFHLSPGCDIMTDSTPPGSGPAPYADMEWLNNLVSSWYSVNCDKVHDVVKKLLETELNKVTPDNVDIRLEECTFGDDTPSIKGIKSRVVETKCMGGVKQKKVVFDIILSLDSPDFEFKLGVKVPLLTLRAAVQKLSFIGNLRVTALFSDKVPFPGIQNLCITFTDRPNLGFNIELLDAIDIDTFGIDHILTDAIEDILAKQLVYPGRLYVDLGGLGTGGKIETIMMPRESDQHPGVVTTNITVSRIHHDTDTTKVQVGVELGANDTRRALDLKMDSQTVTENYLIKDFDTDELTIKVWESRLIFKDIQYGSVKIDLADMEFSLPSVTQNFTNQEKNVNVSVKVDAYLLPLIAIKQEGTTVSDYHTRFSGDTCHVPTDLNTGVMYIHVHRATGLPSADERSKSDPFVTVYLDGNEVLKTAEVTNSNNPVFDEWAEFLVYDFSAAEITFKVDDNDVWPNTDDPIGVVTTKMSKEYIRNVNKELKLETRRDDVSSTDMSLYVSFVYRPVPLAQ